MVQRKMSKILLKSEIIPIKLSPQQLNEAKSWKGSDKFIVTAVIQRANAKNENGRIYRKETLDREIGKYKSGPVAEKRAYGELDHSEDLVINLKNVCINIMEIWWEGEDVHAIIEILKTPSGLIVQELLKAGLSVGISSRGAGSVSQVNEDTVEVDDDFVLCCWDVVSSPSTHGAYLHPKQINESVKVDGIWSNIDQIISDILCMNLGFCECSLK